MMYTDEVPGKSERLFASFLEMVPQDGMSGAEILSMSERLFQYFMGAERDAPIAVAAATVFTRATVDVRVNGRISIECHRAFADLLTEVADAGCAGVISEIYQEVRDV